MSMVQSNVMMRPQQQQQEKSNSPVPDWLRPVGSVASMFGIPYLSMAIGAADMLSGNPMGAVSMFGAGGGDNPLLQMLNGGGKLAGAAGSVGSALGKAGGASNLFNLGSAGASASNVMNGLKLPGGGDQHPPGMQDGLSHLFGGLMGSPVFGGQLPLQNLLASPFSPLQPFGRHRSGPHINY